MPNESETVIKLRRTDILLPQSLWDSVEEWRLRYQCSTRTEAIRRLLQKALAGEKI